MKRVLGLLALGATLSTGAPVMAAPAVPQLAGVTTVRATRPVSLDVRVPRATSLRTPLNDAPELTIRGGGSFVAIALVGTDVRTKGTKLIGGAFAGADRQSRFLMPVNPVFGSSSYEFGKNYADAVRLTAGSYRLFVVPDGKAVTVTLRLSGLRGSTRLQATRAVRASLAYPSARLLGASGVRNVYSAGVTVSPTHQSLMFHGLWYDTAAHAGGQVVLCQGAPAMELVPSQPACLNPGQAAAATNDRTPTTGPDAKMHLHAFGPLPPDTYSMGFSYVTESVVTDLRYVTVVIPL